MNISATTSSWKEKLKKLKKGVDFPEYLWYYNQAVAKNGAQNTGITTAELWKSNSITSSKRMRTSSKDEVKGKRFYQSILYKQKILDERDEKSEFIWAKAQLQKQLHALIKH